MLFFKRLGKRGAALTEYAILLAFVAAIGASFTASNGLEDSIRGAIGKAEKVLAADTNNPGDSGAGSGGSGAEEGESGGGSGSGSGGEGGNTGGSGDNTSGGDGGNSGSGNDGNTSNSGGSNVGFIDEEDENKYGKLVNDLIDYLFDTYDGEGHELTGAQITGNGNNLEITYKDAEGNSRTESIDNVKIMEELSSKYNQNLGYGYDIKDANLNFGENKTLVDGTGDKNNTFIQVWPDENGQGKGKEKETIIIGKDGKLDVESKKDK